MLTGILAVIIGLGTMVLVHEWGHFIVARFFGVRVESFSIGFGPRIWGFRRGDTDYRLSILPLGGYVRMAGDNPSEERTGAADEFLSKPRWQRALIAVAGPIMNFLMAVILMAALFMHGGEQLSYADKPVVIAGVLKDSAAQKAGITAGDRIVSFGGIKDPTWERLNVELGLSPGRVQPVVVDRSGQQLDLSVHTDPDPTNSVGYPVEPVLVGAVSHGLPAEKAGLLDGDQVTGIGGQQLVSPHQFADLVQQSSGHPLNLQVLRNGQTIQVPIQPVWGDPGDGNPRWEIGIAFRFSTTMRSYSPPSAIAKATQYELIVADKLIYLVGQLFTGRQSVKQLQGPLGIVQASSQAAKHGFGELISLMALVSLNLGVLNLLPIPILDGGHILMLGIESVLRHDLSLKLKERVVTVGMVFLLSLFLFVMYNDIHRLIPSR